MLCCRISPVFAGGLKPDGGKSRELCCTGVRVGRCPCGFEILENPVPERDVILGALCFQLMLYPEEYLRLVMVHDASKTSNMRGNSLYFILLLKVGKMSYLCTLNNLKPYDYC